MQLPLMLCRLNCLLCMYQLLWVACINFCANYSILYVFKCLILCSKFIHFCTFLSSSISNCVHDLGSDHVMSQTAMKAAAVAEQQVEVQQAATTRSSEQQQKPQNEQQQSERATQASASSTNFSSSHHVGNLIMGC